MINPESMVLINLVFTSILLIFVFFYQHVYPKKKLNYLIILFLVSLLPIISVLRPGTYESGDLSINAIKTMSFYQNLLEGNLIPRWAGELNAEYGYPLFIFTYPLPYYLASAFHLVGFGFIESVKLLLIFSYIFSGVFMYLFLRNDFSKFSSFVGSIFYLFAPYHLIDMHFRVAIGEMLAFMLIPLVFLFETKLLKKPTIPLLFSASFILALLVLSHQAISLATIPFLIFYLVFRIYKKSGSFKKTLYPFLSIFLAILFSAFYTFPLLYYSQLTHQANLAQIVFPKISYLIVSPWMYGFLYQGPMGELSFPIGFPQITIIILAVYLLYKTKLKIKERNNLFFYLLTFIILFFLMTPFSRFVWDLLPLMKNFQFSYRFFLLASFLISIIAALVSQKIDKKIILFLTFISVFFSILNWGNRRNIPEINDAYLKTEAPLSSSKGEGLYPAMPNWTDPVNPFIDRVPEQKALILKGSGEIKEVERMNTRHIYALSLTSDSLIQENTLFFPGWKVYLNDNELEIINKNPITFYAAKGNYELKVMYEEAKIMKVSKLISFSSFLAFFILSLSKGLSTHYRLKTRSYS